MTLVRSRMRRRASRGYTLVELMMALALFTVAVLGIISLQKLVVVSNAHAKNVSIAQRIAQSWASQLQLDSTRWRTDRASTLWLGNVGDGWEAYPYNTDRQFGSGFDALGNPVSNLANAQFCANVRLTWLYAENTPVMGNGMMRAEIRVFWLRDGEETVDRGVLCRVDGNAGDIGKAVQNYHFVYHTAGIRQHASI